MGDHQDRRAQFLEFLRRLDKMTAVLERFVALIVLHGMSHFVCGDRNSGQRVTSVLVRRQPYCLVVRIIVIAFLGFLDFDRLHAVLVQQMTGKLGAGAGITVRGLRVPGQDMLYPDAGQEDDAENNQAEEEQGHILSFYAK